MSLATSGGLGGMGGAGGAGGLVMAHPANAMARPANAPPGGTSIPMGGMAPPSSSAHWARRTTQSGRPRACAQARRLPQITHTTRRHQTLSRHPKLRLHELSTMRTQVVFALLAGAGAATIFLPRQISANLTA